MLSTVRHSRRSFVLKGSAFWPARIHPAFADCGPHRPRMHYAVDAFDVHGLPEQRTHGRRGTTRPPDKRPLLRPNQRRHPRRSLAAFRERNRTSTDVPATAVPGTATTTPEAKSAAAQAGQRLSVVTFSAPAYSEDSYALVFTSYTCGNLCAYEWFLLVRKTADHWQVVDKHLAWIT